MTEAVRSILIVEDEALVALDLQEMLADMGYAPFAIAASADEALTAASDRCPDIVLMDIRIRGSRDGIETAALLRDRFDVPVVYLTAHADTGTIARAKHTQPYGYLMKPVKAADLRNVIELALHRHETERRVRERERRFATTLRAIPDAVVAIDPNANITFMNSAAEERTRIAFQDALGRPAREVMQALDRSGGTSQYQRLVGEDGADQGAVIVHRDATEQQMMRRQIERADRLASLGSMAAGVAHQVNNPLAVVVANSSFVLDELKARLANDPELEAAVDAQSDIESAAHRIAHTIAELQTFARPSSLAGDSDVAAIAQWAVRATTHALAGRGTARLAILGSPRARLDAARLGQVLVNLITNAAQAVPVGDHTREVVTVAASTVGEHVTIEVRDRGTGMSRETVERAFEPFFTTRDVGAGSGLGLPVCHGIVVAAGGTIEIASELGVGTTVRLRLPSAAPAQPLLALETGDSSTLRGRILVIEDEPLLLKAMRRILKDHDVVSFSDAREALALLEGGAQFDIIFSDMMMPLMTGMDFYERLAASRPDLMTKMVFITGGSVTAPIDAFLAKIPNVRLEKPIATDAMRSFVQQRLAGTVAVP